jgi:quinone-modifying oxidoreductase, subunit QmoC
MKAVQQTVLYEQAMDPRFLDEVYTLPGGEKIKDCIQCGTCSGSCPVSWAMEETPRQIFDMIRAGMRDQILDSLTIWTCASCYQCAARCPQEIKITDVMYMLKRMAIREKRERSRKASSFAGNFVKIVTKYGRSREVELLIRYRLGNNPLLGIARAPVGISLWARGRFPLGGSKVKDIAGLRNIIAKAQELGGEA